MTVENILHKNIKIDTLLQIIKVKSVAWNYSLEEQLTWIERNLQDEDIHVLMLNDESEIVAYLNLIKIDLLINELSQSGYGLGNVCVSIKGKGYGAKLMREANQYLIKKRSIGLLFCKDELVEFYKRSGWKIVEENILVLDINTDKINTMIFNIGSELNSLRYNGKSF